MVADDEIRLGADAYLSKLVDSQTFLDRLWSAIKIATVGLALLLSFYSLLLASRVSNLASEEVYKIQEDINDEDAFASHQSDLIAAINASLREVITEHKDVLSTPIPVMFDCFRVHRLTRATTVTYDGCFVDTTEGAIDIYTGIFTVAKAGVYTISFTAKYVSSSKGRFGAWSDVFVNNTVIGDSQREYNGNSESKTESSTHTILVLYPLQVGHQVKVQFNKDGTSYIHSDDDHDVHFTARRISDLPLETTTTTTTTSTTTTYPYTPQTISSGDS